MPQLANLGPVQVYMYYGDHPPPHFHILENEASCLVGIEGLDVLAGRISPRGLKIALAWAEKNQGFLLGKWQQFNEED